MERHLAVLLGLLIVTPVVTGAATGTLPYEDLVERQLQNTPAIAFVDPAIPRAMPVYGARARPSTQTIWLQAPDRVIVELHDPVSFEILREAARNMTGPERAALMQTMREHVIRGIGRADHRYHTFNGFSVPVTPQQYAALAEHPFVKSVQEDVPVQAMLSSSVPLINATQTWQLEANGQNLTGHGQTVCVIDTGIDYSHADLGGCLPTTYTTSGTTEAHTLESDHPYANGEDITYTITKPGYTSIAAHFSNLSLEYPGQGGFDTTDRVIIYDGNDVEVARYHGSASGYDDLWTPHVQGDTIKIRLVSDGSVNDHGFVIDQVIDGTTSSTIDFSSCRVSGGWDFVNNDADPQDDQGHGTHVAGIVAASGGVEGTAPDADLVAIKSLDAAGNGYTSNILAGIEWCTTNSQAYNISVISMSLGTRSPLLYSAACDGTFSGYASAIDAATAKNISVLAAAGNDGDTSAISAPACISSAIPIASTTKSDGMSSFSNRNSLANLTAPGSSISSTRNGGGYTTKSGTSMATPHAAGAFALLRQYLDASGQPMTPAEMETVFTNTGKAIPDTGSGLTYSRIDVYDAVIAATLMDDTPPNTSDDAPSGWQTAPFTVTLSATDNTSGVRHTWHRVDASVWVEDSTVSISTDGNHTIDYYSVDNAGNAEDQQTTHAALDISAPLTIDDASDGWSTTALTINLSATDNGSGVAYTTYRLDGGAWTNGTSIAVEADGNHTIEYHSTDAVGRTETTNAASVAIDTVDPATSDDAPAGWRSTAFTVELTPTDATSGVAYTTYRVDGGGWMNGTSVSVATDGNHSIEYFSTDAADNQETVRTTHAALETAAPSTTDDAPSDWSNTPVNVTLSPTDAASGVAYTSYRTDGGAWTNGTTVAVTAEGNTTIEYFSVDDAGNTETVRTAWAAIDTVDPATTDDASAGWQSSSYAVTLSGTDATAGIAYTTYRIDGGDWTNGTSVSISADGNHTIEYFSVDAAGNQEPTKTVHAALETSAPTTTDDAPHGWSSDPVTVTLTPTDAASGIAYTSFTVDGGTWQNGTEAAIASDGNHSIEYFSVDNAGNQEPIRTAYAAVDATDPQTTDDAPIGWQAAPFSVVLDAADATSGTAYTSYRMDGGGWVNGTSVSVSTDGNHTIEYFSVDAAGNQEPTRSVPVALDATEPAIANLTVEPNKPSTNDTLNISFHASDALTGIASVQATLGGVAASLNSTNGSAEGSVPAGAEGNKTLLIHATDAAGNTAQLSRTVHVYEVREEEIVLNGTAERDYSDSLKTSVRITPRKNATGNLSLRTTKSNPTNASLSNGKRFVEIELDANETNATSSVLLRIHYDSDDIAGLDEASLRMAYYNESGAHWINLTSDLWWVIDTGVDTDNGFVWADLMNLSLYALSGDDEDVPEEEGSGGSGGGGGGGSTGSGGAGGGGGGGAAVSDPEPTDLEEITRSIRFFSAGQEHSFRFASTRIPLTGLRFVTDEDGLAETITIEATQEDAPGVDLGGFSVSSEDLAVRDVELTVQITQERLQDVESITIYAREGGSWTPLETHGSNATYTATTDAFGSFAVAAEPLARPDPEPVVEQPQQETPAQDLVVTKEPPVRINEEDDRELHVIFQLLAAILAAGGAVVVLLHRGPRHPRFEHHARMHTVHATKRSNHPEVNP